MAYNYEYPYTDPNRYNADWLLNKIKELDDKVSNITEDILSKAEDFSKRYTDEQIALRLADVEQEFRALKTEVETEVARLDGQYDSFTREVNNRLNITEGKFRQLEIRVDSLLKEANAYTNYAIQQNNAFIIDETTKALDTVTVVNYFTGARVSIQAMFDYLAQFHLENAISVQTLVDRAKTVDTLVGLNMTMTDLATNGGSLITP